METIISGYPVTIYTKKYGKRGGGLVPTSCASPTARGYGRSAVVTIDKLPTKGTQQSITGYWTYVLYEAFGPGPTYSVKLTRDYPASLPRYVVEEREAVQDLLRSGEIEKFISLVEQDAAREREEAQRSEIARHAMHLGRWVAKTASAKAKAAVRWDQRVAALQAEMEEELKVQAALAIEEAHKEQPGGLKYSDGEEIPTLSVIAATEYLDRFLHVPSTGSPFRTSADEIRAEDIKKLQEEKR